MMLYFLMYTKTSFYSKTPWYKLSFAYLSTLVFILMKYAQHKDGENNLHANEFHDIIASNHVGSKLHYLHPRSQGILSDFCW